MCWGGPGRSGESAPAKPADKKEGGGVGARWGEEQAGPSYDYRGKPKTGVGANQTTETPLLFKTQLKRSFEREN